MENLDKVGRHKVVKAYCTIINRLRIKININAFLFYFLLSFFITGSNKYRLFLSKKFNASEEYHGRF